MIKYIFFICICFSALRSVKAQDKIDDITIYPIEHATFAITWKEKTLLFDPSTEKEKLNKVKSPDLIFITDIHGDHFNISSLKNLDLSRSILIVPPVVAEQLPDELRKQSHLIKNGETVDLNDIKIEAVPMYNLPESADAFHTKGRGNGYIITLGNKRIYISGDTEDIPEMRELKDIDIAFLCMNLPYTMTVKQAAEATLAFKPKMVYPYHYRGQNGKSDIFSYKQLVNEKDSSIKVIIRDWYLRNP
ncbi:MULTISPECIES: MBL fold metallo-hydrolase [Olivibacter]|jgi:L-ascorbate metabolism protein UlaG (beta-lactamase superfamily)|uniref:MBL fold metallo-hydrolase n=1 Tax=Olivibacter oleidegradans TaxID=760123 RepID=A0ABV6HHZ0_9SPHI|nr:MULTISPECIES: MBL fold metallo-hydrolase [Olivibacter]MDM8174588.1 MBL fold metallo-hydrolase [Olivibacter sp. 47]QEL01392.1 MBL fold metallo-hydrolase [Olivibacter sp. LS-1]